MSFYHQRCGLSLGMVRSSLLLCLLTVPAFGASFSFVGTFQHDNDVQFFTFTVPSAQTVTLQTLGYGGSANNTGGTNAAGNIILAGGFEPYLQLFNPDGTPNGSAITPVPPAPACGLRTPDPNRLNSCQDLYTQISLNPGDYTLALTQAPNVANGNVNDGFLYDGDPNFNNGFMDSSGFGFQGTGNWAVDIVNVDQAAAVGAPEPATALLIPASLMILGLTLRKTQRAKLQASTE